MKLALTMVFGGILLLAGGSVGVAVPEPKARPNLILILAEDLGWKDVGYAGSTFYRTPSIDRLATGFLAVTNRIDTQLKPCQFIRLVIQRP
jgi:hypothetical protein